MMNRAKDSETGDNQVRGQIVCRCEEVTESEIRESIRQYGLDTVAEVKRATRAGMGLCQGRSCEPTIKRILAEETGRDVSEIRSDTSRPPTVPIEIGTIASVLTGGTEDEKN